MINEEIEETVKGEKLEKKLIKNYTTEQTNEQ